MNVQNQTDTSRPGATIQQPEHLRPVFAATSASLPVTVRDAARTVRALDGQARWVQKLATKIDADGADEQASEARAFLVLAPGVQDPATLTQLQAATQRRKAPVVLDHPFADDPAVAGLSTALADVDGLTSATVRTVDARRPLLDVLAEQVLLLGRLGVEDIDLEIVHRAHRGAVAHGGGARHGTPLRISLMAIASEVRGSCQVRLEGPDAAADIDLLPADDARPAHAVLVTDEGELSLPARHESAHRVALRRALTVDAAADLDEFARACAVLD